jgi:hypothetical protein
MVEDPGMTPKVEFARYLDGEPLLRQMMTSGSCS